MNLSEQKPLTCKEKQKEKTHSLLNSRRMINKIRKIKPKNLRKKVSHKRIKKIDETTTNNPLFFSSLTYISKELPEKNNLSTPFTIQLTFLILAFLQPLFMKIYIALVQQKLLISYHRSLWNEKQFANTIQILPLATTATGFWQSKKSTDQMPNNRALPVMRTD
ncbi:hypothetical protein [Rickettsiella endosymbiont of Dermanyssus gallinae]|uniref:hypothetical protein n=1 Tax=Rickettsiella endosymbiont of Dermanyssus gallinae TaxID=2856608 RepID=UPI001C52E45B|nr:hypothetical protein [Rickettsiella endosymbiont of Dermanyssus gallinae]